ncbi:MAG: adaptor protein MecA [Lachnospiraceae bacterium]|nr:adaptor protein MecA [Lachnospiraceae bacterium]
MKIEKLNEHQIRCTLTKEDLAIRHIKLSELAYGSEKTRQLFQDMMNQASADFGFEVDDIPLMVEAIPMSSEKLVLIITKVESPDELDTRFSEFSQYRETEDGYLEEVEEEEPEPALDLPEDLIELLSQIKNELTEAGECPAAARERARREEAVCLFTFADIDAAIPAARAVAEKYRGQSALYRDEDGAYLLFLHQGSHSPMEFSRVCHTMTAYLKKRKCASGTEAYCREHARVILAGGAVETLAEI